MTTVDPIEVARLVLMGASGAGGALVAVKKYINGGLGRIERKLDDHILVTSGRHEHVDDALGGVRERLASVEATIDERGKTLTEIQSQIARVRAPARRKP